MSMIVSRVLRSWRWLFNVECSEPWCSQRRICWLWHVELMDCPTCGTTLTEFHPHFGRIVKARFDGLPLAAYNGRTWSTGTTFTENFIW